MLVNGPTGSRDCTTKSLTASGRELSSLAATLMEAIGKFEMVLLEVCKEEWMILTVSRILLRYICLAAPRLLRGSLGLELQR